MANTSANTSWEGADSKVAVLRRIVAQEAKIGYSDRTVIGGLDLFLTQSADQLRPALGDLKPYSVLTRQDRRRWAEEVAARIESAVSDHPDGPSRRKGDTAGPASPPRRRPARRKASSASSKRPERLTLDSPIGALKIQYPPRSKDEYMSRLDRLGVRTLRDVIAHFPHRHDDFQNIRKVKDLVHGEAQTIIATVWEASRTRHGPRSKDSSTQAVLGDETGNVRAVWHGQGYLAGSLKTGRRVAISGMVKTFKGRHVFESPAYEFLSGQDELLHTGRLVPVYPTTDGLPIRTIRRIVKAALDAVLTQVEEFLPAAIRERVGLVDLRLAIAQFHFPASEVDLRSARRRLAFDELLILQLALLTRRRQWQDEAAATPLPPESALVDGFLASLPFDLTGAQQRVIGEVSRDLSKNRPMVRLLQGDVGSGKTVVAIAALLSAVDAGRQGAFMAPTEILAEQHFTTVGRLLAGGPPEIDESGVFARAKVATGRSVGLALLTGGTPKAVRRRLHKLIMDGEVDIVVGTHALIQESVDIPKLAVGIVDEQHRFGVMQRATLGEGLSRPHMLAMSATPIPRSLALTVFGDLDVSVLDQMPPGRRPVKTRLVAPEQRDAAYEFVRGELVQGRQAFVVFPLVDKSEAVRARAATDEHIRLSRDVFPDHRLGLLHGRMKPREKEEIMERFSAGELDVLVSTSVIEVGIDVPNATVMVIDGADRFGLAQLHQFRGRVGRGAEQSYCLLLSDSVGPEAMERLRLIEQVTDGFQLAEEDLRMRGPGDYLGTRQSGLPGLKVASLADTATTSLARREAQRLIEEDPGLKEADNRALAERLSLALEAAGTRGG